MTLIDKIEISDLTRQDILEIVVPEDTFENRANDERDLLPILREAWPLHEMPSTDHRCETLDEDIVQHTINNRDWDRETLFIDRLGLLSISDEQFGRFLNACVHPSRRLQPTVLGAMVHTINELLAHDGFQLIKTDVKSGRPIYSMARTTDTVDNNQTYEVALSFAGQNREYVEHVAEYLTANGVTIFYDRYEEVNLWGKNLFDHFAEVYGGKAKFCLMFMSTHYASRPWTNHERSAAQAYALDRDREYILPVRLDDADIPGLPKTVHAVDGRVKTPEQIGQMVMEKLGRTGSAVVDPSPILRPARQHAPTQAFSPASYHPFVPLNPSAGSADELIEDLENARSFAEAKSLMARLSGFGAFSVSQADRILAAFCDNDQVECEFGSADFLTRIWNLTSQNISESQQKWAEVYKMLEGAEPRTSRARLRILIGRAFGISESGDPK